MRVSDQTRHFQNLRNLEGVTKRMDRVQEQLASGKRVQRASDDPAGISAALGYRTGIAFETQMRRNVENATSLLDISDAALGSATEAMQRVRELAVQAASDTLGADERTAIASEVDQLTQQLVQVANTNFGGEYIFAGHQTGNPAFVSTGQPATGVTYQGDSGIRTRQISATDTVEVNIPGSTIFGTAFADLISFRQALEANAPAAQLQQGIAAMDTALDKILAARSQVGARTVRLAATKNQSETTDLTLQSLKANVEDIDIAEAIVNLNAQQNALQATLGAIGRTANMTLLDFLR